MLCLPYTADEPRARSIRTRFSVAIEASTRYTNNRWLRLAQDCGVAAAGDVRHERRLPQGVWRRDLGAMRDERARAEARENGREIAGVSLFAILPLLGWACARGAGFVARGRQLLR